MWQEKRDRETEYKKIYLKNRGKNVKDKENFFMKERERGKNEIHRIYYKRILFDYVCRMKVCLYVFFEVNREEGGR